MRLWWLFGAGPFVALGMDCARAPRADDAANDVPNAPGAGEAPTAQTHAPAQPDASAGVGESTEDPPSAPVPAPPATRYAALGPADCAQELDARAIAHEPLTPRLGITSPVRLRGPLSGVSFRTLWPEPARARTSFEIYDCRLVLALDDFAKLLRARGIIDVMIFSAYRPPPAGWSEAVGMRHEGGLAIDIGYFRKADGTALNVEQDFMPRHRERVCVPGPPPRDATRSSIELRKIVCEASSAELFHLVLTPSYDRVHRDHFHLELAPDKTDFVVR